MKNYCAFNKTHSCPLWTDYELTRYELEEANSLCHGNWIEIERQYKYIQTLQKSYPKTISHILMNMILNNYSRGPRIIPDPQTRHSSLSLKPAPHDWPSISSANPQELWLSYLTYTGIMIWQNLIFSNETNLNLSAHLYKIIPFSELLTIFLQPIKLNDQNTLLVATLYMYFL